MINRLSAIALDRTTQVRKGATICLTSAVSDGLASNDPKKAEGEKLRLIAIEALSDHPDIAEKFVPIMIDALSDDDPQTRLFAARRLGEYESGAGPAVPALSRILRDGNDEMACGGQLRSDSADDRTELRLMAIEALGKIGAGTAPAVGDLIVALADQNSRIREQAANALGQIGPAAGMAVPFSRRGTQSR